MLGERFSEAKREHTETSHDQGKASDEKMRPDARVGRALINARRTGGEPFAAVEAVAPWASVTQGVTDAARWAQPAACAHLPPIANGYRRVRRYAPRLREHFAFHAAPAARHIPDGVSTPGMRSQAHPRAVPEDAPTGFVKPRWGPYALQDGGIDRRFYEPCAPAELKNA